MTKTVDFDVMIVGGGLVGASLAAALAPLPLRVGVLEAVPFGARSQPGYDDRAAALSWGSRQILDGIGVWSAIEPEATPIRQVHVSERGRFGIARLSAHDYGVPALGYVVPNRVLGAALAAFLATRNNVELLCPATVNDLTQDERGVRVNATLDGAPRTFSAGLLVAADGARSRIREQLGIGARVWEYGQSAIIVNVTPEHHHQHIAYERFTSDGPVALLPLAERCAVVCTVPTAQADDLLALDDADFLAHLQARFGKRMGILGKAGARQQYPLALVRAQTQVRGRVVIAGNAAHSLHPIAGQGFNLSLRDTAALAEVIATGVRDGQGIDATRALRDYEHWRVRDQRATVAFTDALARLFGNPLAAVKLGRGLGLVGLELLPFAKHELARHTMGLAGRLPRLARGLKLEAGS